MNKKCNFCGHTNFKQTKVQYIYRHNDKFLIVNDVPCEQCEFCGEQYFKGRVLRCIEKEFLSIHEKGKKPLQELIVPMGRFAELEPV